MYYTVQCTLYSMYVSGRKVEFFSNRTASLNKSIIFVKWGREKIATLFVKNCWAVSHFLRIDFTSMQATELYTNRSVYSETFSNKTAVLRYDLSYDSPSHLQKIWSAQYISWHFPFKKLVDFSFQIPLTVH